MFLYFESVNEFVSWIGIRGWFIEKEIVVLCVWRWSIGGVWGGDELEREYDCV